MSKDALINFMTMLRKFSLRKTFRAVLIAVARLQLRLSVKIFNSEVKKDSFSAAFAVFIILNKIKFHDMTHDIGNQIKM